MPIDRERVGLDDGHTVGGKLWPQLLDQPPVDLDGEQVTARVREQAGERASAGAYLDDQVARFGRDAVDDAARDLPVGKEVLSETLLGGNQSNTSSRAVSGL